MAQNKIKMKQNDNIKDFLKNNLKSLMLGYEKEKNIIKDLFLRVLKENESNSALLIGTPRSGKTLVRNFSCYFKT
jgi:predicted AAA+ superfamily ATPase